MTAEVKKVETELKTAPTKEEFVDIISQKILCYLHQEGLLVVDSVIKDIAASLPSLSLHDKCSIINHYIVPIPDKADYIRRNMKGVVLKEEQLNHIVRLIDALCAVFVQTD
jgi:hypothetical protein